MPNTIVGTAKDDVIKGTSNDDAIYGLAGNDTIDGGNGNDIITGGGKDSILDGSNLVMARDFAGSVTVEIPSKGAANPVGMYKIDAGGNISDVRLISNGAQGTTTVAATLKPGERYGFFVLSNGYGNGNGKKLLADTSAKWELRDEADGTPDLADASLRLWHVNALTGVKTLISFANGHEIYHSTGAAANGFKPNPDASNHATTVVDYALGVVTIGLESGKGGNPDFADAIIKFNIGLDNALNLGEPDPVGNGGDDKLSGSEGDDKILGMAGNDWISGGNGQDKLWGNTGNDTINGDAGDDSIGGGSGNDTISGGQGQDKINGNTGNDVIDGGDGDDTIAGNDGNDIVSGGNGNDTLGGGKGVDTLNGGAGDDKINGDTGIDTIDGGDGHDAIKGGDGDDTIRGGAGNDTISGGKGMDNVVGGDGDDKINADTGNDWVWAGFGNDTYNGGEGVDTIDFSEFYGVTVDLKAKTASGAGTDKVESFENVIGTAGDDTITGDSKANLIKAGDGADVIAGGRGSDTLAGGGDSDTFVWTSRKDATGENGLDKFLDHITDFAMGDVLDFRFLPDLKSGQTAADAVHLREEAGSTILSAVLASGGAETDIVVLDGVTGLTIVQLYTDGALLV